MNEKLAKAMTVLAEYYDGYDLMTEIIEEFGRTEQCNCSNCKKNYWRDFRRRLQSMPETPERWKRKRKPRADSHSR